MIRALVFIIALTLIASWVPAPVSSRGAPPSEAVDAYSVQVRGPHKGLTVVSHAASDGATTAPSSESDQLAPPETDAASSIVVGLASYCAPTPRYCKHWGGHAMLGAVPGYGGKPYWAKVTHGDRSIVVRVVSFCACGAGKVVDLSPFAFKLLNHGSLAAGVIPVTLESGDTVPPATDAE